MQGRNFVVKVYEPALRRAGIQELNVAHAAAYLRQPCGYGWCRYPIGPRINGPFHHHHDHALYAPLPCPLANRREQGQSRPHGDQNREWNRE